MNKCAFDDENLCQSKSSGGHYGDIRSVNKMYCAKKIDSSQNKNEDNVNLEEEFLKNSINHKLFKDFIPKYKDICVDNNDSYVVIENLKYGLEQPIVIDLKIGRKTANKEILILNKTKKNIKQKLLKHQFIDTKTISNKYGYRAEGMDSDIKIQRGTLQKLIPEKLFKIYFSKDVNHKALLSIIKQLEIYYERISRTIFDSIVMVGSSILILYDGKNPKNARVKIIDFANSYNYDDKLKINKYNMKFIKYYRQGVKRLIFDLKLFHLHQSKKSIKKHFKNKTQKEKLSLDSVKKTSVRPTHKTSVKRKIK
jgi:hypothetical protein